MSKQKSKKSLCSDCKNRSVCDDPCNPSSCELKNQQEIEIKIAQQIEQSPLIMKVIGQETCLNCGEEKHDYHNECSNCDHLNVICCGLRFNAHLCDCNTMDDEIKDEDNYSNEEPLFSGDDFEWEAI